MIKTLPALLLLALLSGCGIFGSNPAPPSKAESYLFDVVTNMVPRQAWKTNIVDVLVPVWVLKTNEQNQITQLTNSVIVKQVELTLVTNMVEAYDWKPKTNTLQLAQTAGTIGNAVMPGSGGLISGILMTGLLAWGRLRSSKKTNINLVQGTEVLLELIQSLPDGNKNVSAAKQFLQKSQSIAGVIKQVAAARADVDSFKAKSSATEIQATVDRLKQ